MSSRPRVYMTQSVVMDGEAMQELQRTCDLIIYDEQETGKMNIPREKFLHEVPGVDALFLALPTKVDAEVLDAAGRFRKISELYKFTST